MQISGSNGRLVDAERLSRCGLSPQNRKLVLPTTAAKDLASKIAATLTAIAGNRRWLGFAFACPIFRRPIQRWQNLCRDCRFAAAPHLGDLPIAWLKGTPDLSKGNAVAALIAKL
jgi:hypothetical protein